ncbi:hypothetical protein B0A52_00692 [Exophiala mesophila]|uniref:Transcription factor domain-containing protein n=1 Tax=Exophiala mesophila TaxID=212818 RepID=A0A438NHX7_EXOME|nr:hypothetical protein B0A52_00692 [Exophiala mesophila]
MEFSNYHFILLTPSKEPRSQRAIELERSSVRSHAARVTFRRARLQRQVLYSNQQLNHERGQLSLDGKPTHEAESRCRQQPQRHQTDEEPSRRPTVLPIPISTSMLDPFLLPATELTVPDRHLLHHYMTLVPDGVFGVASKELAHMIREVVIRDISTKPCTLAMILFSAESGDLSFQPTDWDRRQSILKRRGNIYALIRQFLAGVDETGAGLNAFTLSLATMAAAEKRLGNVGISKIHMRAVKKIIDMHGGLNKIREIDSARAIMLVNILIEVGTPDFQNQHSMAQALTWLQQKLRAFQAWNYWLRLCDISTAALPGDIEPLSTGAHRCHARHLQQWASFFETPALSDYITPPPGSLTTEEYRSYLATLFIINTAFWAFRDSSATSAVYLRDIATAAANNQRRESVLRCFGTNCATVTLLIMMTHHAANVQGPDQTTADVFAVEEIVDFVDLMMRASPWSRDFVLRALRSYLCETEFTGLTYMSNATLDALVNEIRVTANQEP